MRRITSALFLDFDNIFSGLLKADREAAYAFVDRPGSLIERLSSLDERLGVTREVLVRRAYLNPSGTIPDPAGDRASTLDRLAISEFRAPLTKGGFEVVDCPPLARGKKNAADIRMVIDALDVLTAAVRYDEIIIASSDADFTPLLVKLRANDRRTMILTTGAVAAPYGSAVDRCVGESELVRLLAPPLELIETRPTRPPHAAPRASALNPKPEPNPNARAARRTPKVTPDENRALQALTALLAATPGAVSLSTAGTALRRTVGTDVVDQTRWFGHKTLTALIRARRPKLEVTTTSVWDPARHPAPAAKAG